MTETKTDTRQNIQTQRRDAKGKLLPKVTDTPTKAILDAANGALRRIRDLHPEVPNVVLVIGTSSTKALGHFAKESWDGKAAQHEIMISGEGLAKGAEDVLDTLIHECAHALAHSRDIKDTSRQGRFHNKRFKLVAEEMGLDVDSHPSIGWSLTTLPKATAIQYRTELAELRKALKTYRIVKLKPKAAKTTMKIECGCRSVTIPIKFFEKGALKCLSCNGEFVDANAEAEDNEEGDGWKDENPDE